MRRVLVLGFAIVAGFTASACGTSQPTHSARQAATTNTGTGNTGTGNTGTATTTTASTPTTTTNTASNPCDVNDAADYNLSCPVGSPAEIAVNEADCATYQNWLQECAAGDSMWCDDVTPGDPGYLPNPCGNINLP